jgi:hypothetical protein
LRSDRYFHKRSRKKSKKIKIFFDLIDFFFYHTLHIERVAIAKTPIESRGRIAQLVEHLPYKQVVTGSSPVSPTNFLKSLKKNMDPR